MGRTDRLPLAGTPTTARLALHHNNRLGAVYSSLYSFWTARTAAIVNGAGAAVHRRDAYSVILFDSDHAACVNNDFASSPDQLLTELLRYGAGGGTNYMGALSAAQVVMETNWSTERCAKSATAETVNFHIWPAGPLYSYFFRMVNAQWQTKSYETFAVELSRSGLFGCSATSLS